MSGPALDGTECDVDKWCYAGKCVTRISEISLSQANKERLFFSPAVVFIVVGIIIIFVTNILIKVYSRQSKWRREEIEKITKYQMFNEIKI